MSDSAEDDHKRTLTFAEIALAQIKALRQPATPRHFELWYHYATGYNPSLNQTINETLTRDGVLRDADIDQIYDSHLSPSRISEHLDDVGARVMEEIERVMTMIGNAAGSASSYTESLAGMTRRLDTANPDVRAIVQGLVKATRRMEDTNKALEARLSASRQEITILQQSLDSVRNESMTDPLTSLANRKFFDDMLASAIADASAHDEPLSMMMADIDHFKKFNDSYGHLTGDQVLRLVALAIKQNVKGQDIATRYGGEEFAIVLPRTVLRAATTLADHIRRAVLSKELLKRSTGENLGRITVSIGVASLRANDTPRTLIERADACLYAAKRNGRNRVICETDPEAMGPSIQVA